MSFLTGGKPKAVKAPPTPAPVPIATTVSPEVQRATETTRRRLTSGRGRRGTILTQDEQKRTVLG